MYVSQFLLINFYYILFWIQIMKGIAAENLIESFPHYIFQFVIGQPIYDSIAEVHLKLSSNAASILSNRGNGKLGHLFLTLSEVRNTLSTAQFVPLANPGLNPDIPEGATGYQIANLRRNDDNLLEEFNTYDQADKILKSINIVTFEEAYIRSLRNKKSAMPILPLMILFVIFMTRMPVFQCRIWATMATGSKFHMILTYLLKFWSIK